jgi:3D (Asp-Asp-Asp) domain-containing protein
MNREILLGAILLTVLILLIGYLGGLSYGEKEARLGQRVQSQTEGQAAREGKASAYKTKKETGTTGTEEREEAENDTRNEPASKRTSEGLGTSGNGSEELLHKLAKRKEGNESAKLTAGRHDEEPLYSSKQKQKATDRSSDTSNYDYLGTFKLTGYTAGPESTGKSPGDNGYGITYSGEPVEKGVTAAADLNVLPIGTIVYIEGVGTRVIQDKGGAVDGKHIDVYFKRVSKALDFGVREAKVYVVKWGAVNE